MENTKNKLPIITIFDYDETETETDNQDPEDTDDTLSVEELEDAVFDVDGGELK